MNDFLNRVNKTISETKALASTAIDGAGEKLRLANEGLNGIREKNPAVDSALTRVGATLGDIHGRLDGLARNVTGEAALAEANKLMNAQRRYNDVLASRLAEALDRIEALEQRVAELEQTRDR